MAVEKKSRILIIDDEEIVLDSCKMLLRDTGHEVLVAERGDLGLKIIEEKQPDLVFVDLKMPGISGFEVLERAHKIDPNIVAIVITGFATVESAVDAMKNGAYDFLPKPFTPDEFRLILNRGLDRRKLILETIRLRREKEILRDQFAAIVSHELKSPLGAVQQNLYVLEADLTDQLTPEQNERLQRMKVKIDDLIQLIHTWLRVISIDINQLKTSFKPVLVKTAIDKAIESVQPHAVRKNITFVTELSITDLTINGDEGTLVESIVNILTNAVKYSRTDSRITILTKENQGMLEIIIKDQGVGISEEDLPHIFDDFYTGETGGIAPKSSGLGLAITRRIIEAHEGQISVTSQLGKGSTFTITLPVQ